MSCWKFVFVVLACVLVAAPTAMSDPDTVKVPKGLSIGDFDKNLYYCVPLINGSAQYVPDFNFFARVDKDGDNEYSTNTKGEIINSENQPECVQRPDNLTQTSDDTAEFNTSAGALQVFWTSDPTLYYWTLRCHEPQNTRHCPILAVDVGLLVNLVPDDLPWEDVLKDLTSKTRLCVMSYKTEEWERAVKDDGKHSFPNISACSQIRTLLMLKFKFFVMLSKQFVTILCKSFLMYNNIIKLRN
ncbi:hypothetical protein MAR_018734 [Mya arenaria]|uniref:Uncharacterized protein n=1 Tax=Mya arenaria TaxID=6604 RepID=A0ABY7EJ11_MYAAR|nr:hypothetical protein MAR_018734 [Mya arenaria]